jgi:hypothetical protein
MTDVSQDRLCRCHSSRAADRQRRVRDSGGELDEVAR